MERRQARKRGNVASHANVLRGSSRNLSFLRDEPLRTFASEATTTATTFLPLFDFE